jgi:amino acid adenylation domain-containing protein
VLKAGGAYVPVECGQPVGRVRQILEDAAVSILLTEEKYKHLLPARGLKVICVDTDRAEIDRQSDENLGLVAHPDNLAYVMYTSGSTGKPKGVCVTLGAIVNLVIDTNYIKFRPTDRVAQTASASFDAATFEMWGALLNGATLQVIERDVVLSPQALRSYITEHGTNVMFLTTSLFHEIARQAPSTFRGLRDLVVGGEALEVKLAAEVLEHGGVERLVNGYGPTEATTFATWKQVTAETGRAGTVPIGRAISGVRVYVLDESQEVAGVGVAGEVYIGGAGLARGYIGRAGLTAERFVPDGLSKESGARLYRTGDVGRISEGGELEFVGRVDGQVKVRGHRIEPGEIEAALGQHWAVRQALVLAKGEANDKRLVGYVVAYEGVEPTSDELRGFLRKHLPEYMIPAAFVVMEEFPLTPNGKIDVKSLPEPTPVRGEAGGVLLPRDAFELRLTQILEELLGVSPIGIRDNLFEIGMHSLLAAQVMSHVERAFGRALPLSTIFRAATVESFATVLRQEAITGADSPLVPIQPGGRKRPFFCVHPGGGNTLSYIHLARHLGLDRPFYGLEAQAPAEAAGRHRSIEEMAASYVEALRAVQPEGPYQLGGWSMGGIIAFEMAQQLERAGQEVSLLVLMDTHLKAYDELSPDEADTMLLWKFAQNLGVEPDADWVARATTTADGGLLRQILERAKAAGVMPTDLDISQFERLFRIFSDNLRATYEYRPSVYPGRIIFMRPAERLGEALFTESSSEQTDWHGLAADGVEVETVPGDHFTMVREPHVGTLAARLEGYMAS